MCKTNDEREGVKNQNVRNGWRRNFQADIRSTDYETKFVKA